jgi:hypothetical protein
MACAQEPQTRFTVIAGTDTGRPPWTAACRAGFILVPAWMTLPMATVPTSSGLSPARSMAALMAAAPRLGAAISLRLPPKVPIAVRAGFAKTTERGDVILRTPLLMIAEGRCAQPITNRPVRG